MTERNGTDGATTGGNAPASPSEYDLLFRYYEDQWAQVRHRESQRSSLTLNILLLVVAVAAAYIELDAAEIKALGTFLGAFVVGLGAVGYLATLGEEKSANVNIERARNVRDRIPLLKPSTQGSLKFPPIARYYLALHILVAAFGVALILTSWCGG
jgi:hypothetical protein